MNYRDQFQEEEWNLLLTVPVWISTLVRDVTVDPVPGDTIVENFMQLLPQTDEYESPFSKAIFSDLNQGLTSMTFKPDPRNATEGLQAAASIVARKIPDDVAKAFKTDLLSFAITLERSVSPSKKHVQEFSKELAMTLALLFGES